jgi:hypothetical protein
VVALASINFTHRASFVALIALSSSSPKLPSTFVVAVIANLGWTYCAASVAAFIRVGKRTSSSM